MSVVKNNNIVSLTDKDCTSFTFLAISTLVMVWIMFFVPLLFIIAAGIRVLNETSRAVISADCDSVAFELYIPHGMKHETLLSDITAFWLFCHRVTVFFGTRKW